MNSTLVSMWGFHQLNEEWLPMNGMKNGCPEEWLPIEALKNGCQLSMIIHPSVEKQVLMGGWLCYKNGPAV